MAKAGPIGGWTKTKELNMACSWLFGVTQLLAVTPFTCGENPDLCAQLCSSVEPHKNEERQAHIRLNLKLSWRTALLV
jgi:hypothetical protein